MDRIERKAVAWAAVVVPILCIASLADGSTGLHDGAAVGSTHAAVSTLHDDGVIASVVAPAAGVLPDLGPNVIVKESTAPASGAPEQSKGFSRPLAPGTIARTAPLNASTPVRLSIPAIGVDTNLMRLGLLRDGSLEVPPDGFPAGWYTGAPTPGALGPAVIAGHVDWVGPAVFHDLVLLKVGALITVGRADHSVVTFVVTKIGRYAKAEFPTAEVYGNIDFAGLRLITCGGAFNKSTGHYVDNVVVFAKLFSYTPRP